jgi:hypothetical protein
MEKKMIHRPIAPFAALAASLAFLATPAAAQDEGGDRINQLIVFGDDPCPPSTENEITVCARKDESERYRIPENLRTSSAPDNIAWTERVKSYETVGAFGTMSCSPVGHGGMTGCTQQLIDAAYAEKAESSDIRFSQLIEEERARRLATIDEDAAAEQGRVEEIEREYMERLERERAAEDASGQPGDELPQIAPGAEGE